VRAELVDDVDNAVDTPHQPDGERNEVTVRANLGVERSCEPHDAGGEDLVEYLG
jgi:hypothetical protein